jgi:hypothetical protein
MQGLTATPWWKRPNPFVWTDEGRRNLVAGVLAGRALPEIATALGCSESAARKQAYLQGLRLRPVAMQRRVTPELGAKVAAKIVTLPEPREAGDMRTRLIDLRYGQCRYVIGTVDHANTVCCGKPTVGGSSWCDEHAAIVFAGRS